MSNLDFFKKQAKNFFKDWKTRKPTISEFGMQYYEYDSKFFDVGSLILLAEASDKESFSLMKAQYLIAKMVGFKNWNELVNASEKELLLAEILLRHFYDESDIWDWENALIFVGKEESDIDEKIKFARLYYEDYKTGENSGDKIETPRLSDKQLHEIALAKAKPDFEGLKLTSSVVCPHCFQEFYFRDADVAIDSETDELFVCCKNCGYDAYSFIYDSSVFDGRVDPEF